MDPGAGSQPSLSFSVLSSSGGQECVLDSHTTPIHDVAWAPVMGRSYHLIATASREKYFKVHLLRPHLLCVCLTLPSLPLPLPSSLLCLLSCLSQIHILRRFNGISLTYEPGSSQTIQTTSEVWRVAWNVTGTVLVTTSEDGTLSLWRKDFSGEWINVQDLPLLHGQSEPMKVVYNRPLK
jgi:nucleoporin SEH1